VCILCSSYHIYCCIVSYPVLFVIVLCLLLFMFMIVLCLLWSVKVLQMLISCIATICSRASNDAVYVLTAHGAFLNIDNNEIRTCGIS